MHSNRGANCVRAIPHDIKSIRLLKEMQSIFSDSAVLFVYNLCIRIMCRNEFSIPSKMIDCAKAIATEPNQELHREEEQGWLISMLQRGDGVVPNLIKEAKTANEMYNENARSRELIGNARTGDGFVLSSYRLDGNMINVLKGFALKQNPDAIYLLGLLTTYCADLPRLGKYFSKLGQIS